MTKNTLTTVESLRVGDVFTMPGYSSRYVKLPYKPSKDHNRNKYYCIAQPVFGVMPRKFKKNTEVVFLYSQSKTISL